nr:RNA-directed DNA polymerase, eukaryota [Tanacetum cinerariifolium]
CVRAKEVLGWVPDFVEDIKEESDSDDDSYEGEIKSDGLKFSAASDVEGDSDMEAVPESKFKEDPKKHTGDDASLEKTMERVDQEVGSLVEKQTISNNKCVNDVEESICSGHFSKSEVPRTGGSIIQLMDDLVNVGQTMGYDMTGCMKNIKEIIESQGVKEKPKWRKQSFLTLKDVGGNFAFEYVYSEAVGNSGGILCVWDPNMFKKINDTVSDYFTMVRGMWDYLSLVISNWEGEVVIMGDFNEVHDKCERFESVFNRKRKLKAELAYLDLAIDKGDGEVIDVNRRHEVVRLLQEAEEIESLEVTQKAKIKWAIEVDENSKYYHGVLN